MSRRYPNWDVDGVDWPNRDVSRFVRADSYQWHVQDMAGPNASAPVCLLIHGTGAATHSWRNVMPLLAKTHRVIALDLPGHGFTRPNHARRVALPQMARSVGLLLDELDVQPDLTVGHSAGAAIGIELLCQRGWQTPLVGLNPALMPFPGLASRLFPALAKVLFTNPFVAQIFARMARAPADVDRFLRRSTGSVIDRRGVELYQRLFARPGHCDGAIRMMASWDLERLKRQLPRVAAPVLLVHAENDAAIKGSAVERAAELIPGCELKQVETRGHLAHEEQPEQIASLVADFATRHKS